jgi:hypothetical protein
MMIILLQFKYIILFNGSTGRELRIIGEKDLALNEFYKRTKFLGKGNTLDYSDHSMDTMVSEIIIMFKM